jgi:hypothetical protein
MGYVRIKDDLIWASHVEGDAALRERLLLLPAGKPIDLEVDGIVGQWEKASRGKDGRDTAAIKPVGPMKDIWKRYQQRRGDVVPIRETRTADSYLAALNGVLSEWDSPEDDEAFRDL